MTNSSLINSEHDRWGGRDIGYSILAASMAVTAIILSCRLAFYDLFTHFEPWDDDGYMMLASRLLLDGQAIYDKVFTPYGPFHFLVHWFIHRVLHVPITNDAVRVVTFCHWILLSGTCAWTIWQVTRSAAWTIVGYVLVCFYVQAFMNEPGHTQEICAQLVATIPLICVLRRRSGNLNSCMIGLLAGLTVMSKINVGFFCFVGAAMALWSELPNRSKVIDLLLIAGSAIFPFVLMRSHFDAVLCLYSACFASVAMTATVIAAITTAPSSAPTRRKDIALFGAGVAIALAVSLGFIMTQGSTIAGFIRATRVSAEGTQYLTIFIWLPIDRIVIAFLAIPAAVLARRKSRLMTRLILIGQIIFALAAFCSATRLWFDTMIYGIAPWAWLCFYSPASADATESIVNVDTLLPRKIAALLAVWQVLILYPVAGSQVTFGTFMLLLPATICGYEAARGIASIGIKSRLDRKLTIGITGLTCAGLALWQMLQISQSLHRDYVSNSPTHLRGMNWIRLPEARSRVYRELVKETQGADAIYVTSGLNSLFFWSGRMPVIPAIVSHDLRLIPASDRHALVQALNAAKRPLIVYESTSFDDLTPNEMTAWLTANFEGDHRIGPFTILRRKAMQPTSVPMISR